MQQQDGASDFFRSWGAFPLSDGQILVPCLLSTQQQPKKAEISPSFSVHIVFIFFLSRTTFIKLDHLFFFLTSLDPALDWLTMSS